MTPLQNNFVKLKTLLDSEENDEHPVPFIWESPLPQGQFMKLTNLKDEGFSLQQELSMFLFLTADNFTNAILNIHSTLILLFL